MAELKRIFQKGSVGLATLVWCEGMGAWKPLGEVDDLKSLLAAVPPPLPTESVPAREVPPAAQPEPRYGSEPNKPPSYHAGGHWLRLLAILAFVTAAVLLAHALVYRLPGWIDSKDTPAIVLSCCAGIGVLIVVLGLAVDDQEKGFSRYSAGLLIFTVILYGLGIARTGRFPLSAITSAVIFGIPAAPLR
jgi:hypothetical protein